MQSDSYTSTITVESIRHVPFDHDGRYVRQDDEGLEPPENGHEADLPPTQRNASHDSTPVAQLRRNSMHIDVTMASTSSQSTAMRSDVFEGSGSLLPGGWTRQFDLDSGDVFYDYAPIGIQQWTRPVAVTVANGSTSDGSPSHDAAAEMDQHDHHISGERQEARLRRNGRATARLDHGPQEATSQDIRLESQLHTPDDSPGESQRKLQPLKAKEMTASSPTQHPKTNQSKKLTIGLLGATSLETRSFVEVLTSDSSILPHG